MRFYSKKCSVHWINAVPTEDMPNLLPAHMGAHCTLVFFRMAEKLRGREARNSGGCYGLSNLYIISVELFCPHTHAMRTQQNHQTTQQNHQTNY